MAKLGTISVAVGSFRAKAKGNFAKLKKAVCIKLFSAVIKDTPVLSGRLRANWQLTFQAPASGTVAGTEDPTQSVTSAVSQGVTEKDGTVYLSNNLPYAARIEYEGWSHTKAPKGMVRRNMIRIAQNLEAQAAKEATA